MEWWVISTCSWGRERDEFLLHGLSVYETPTTAIIIRIIILACSSSSSSHVSLVCVVCVNFFLFLVYIYLALGKRLWAISNVNLSSIYIHTKYSNFNFFIRVGGARVILVFFVILVKISILVYFRLGLFRRDIQSYKIQ